MSHNIRLTGVIIIALLLGAAGGYMVGQQSNSEPAGHAPVSSVTVREFIEPWTGVGSGVYKHGTIVRVNDEGQPVVIGHFDDETGKDHPGTWVVRKLVTE